MKLHYRCLLVMMALVLLSGCAIIDQWKSMSAKQRAYAIVSTFNGEFAVLKVQLRDYLQSSAVKQRYLRWKRWVLIQVYPLVKEFGAKLESGETDASLESRILGWLNQLLGAVAAPDGWKDPGLETQKI